MERVILVRHGESELSVRGIVNGDPALACGLTPAGVAQARRLGELLSVEPIDLCVTSEFERARETADLALAQRHVPRLVLPELNDPRAGAFESKPLGEYRAWAAAAGPSARPPGGGESRAEAVRRYVRAFRTIVARPERRLLVVGHSLEIRYVLNALHGLDPQPRMELVPYAEPHLVPAAELERAVGRLDAWCAAPVFASAP